MVILGIDPGIATMGYGVVEVDKGEFTALDYGVITTSKDMSAPDRLVKVAKGIALLNEKYSPKAIAIEELFFQTNRKTAILVAEARGVILYSASLTKARIYEYTPNQIKQAITGYGGADKNQMQQMVKILLKLNAVPKPDDAADALAVSICHGQTGKFQELARI